jgi:hypothetical protein
LINVVFILLNKSSKYFQVPVTAGGSVLFATITVRGRVDSSIQAENLLSTVPERPVASTNSPTIASAP